MEIVKLIFTSAVSAGALFVIAKIIGHKQMSQLDFFDYITGITIGSIAAEMATELETPWKPLAAMVVYGAITVLLSVLTSKFPRIRPYINGTPTVLMNNGKIFRENMKKAKLDLSEFLMMCRQEGYFDLDDIHTAVFEYNGRLTILPKADKRPLTPSDAAVTVTPAAVGVEVIMDGRVLNDRLCRIGRDEQWLYKQLSTQGQTHARDVMLGVYHSEDDTLSLYTM